MPRKGYESMTMQCWLIDCLQDAAAPGETPQSVIRRLLLKDLGKDKLETRYQKWRKRYGK